MIYKVFINIITYTIYLYASLLHLKHPKFLADMRQSNFLKSIPVFGAFEWYDLISEVPAQEINIVTINTKSHQENNQYALIIILLCNNQPIFLTSKIKLKHNKYFNYFKTLIFNNK